MAVTATVDKVQSHLLEVIQDPAKQLDDRLLELIDRQVSEALDTSQRSLLLDKLAELLPTLQQDPSPATELIDRIVAPDTFTFASIFSINPPVDFLAGLESPAPPINLTTLRLLEKARHRSSDIGIVAGKADLVRALIRLWLCTTETAVAQKAHDVITGLLVGRKSLHASAVEVNSLNVNDNLMWRRFFRDKDVYESIFSICSLRTTGQEGQPSKRYKTVAQGRLLDLLLVIRAEPVRTPQLPEIELQYGVSNGGLLQFATLQMIDYKDDELMHATLIRFCSDYLDTGPMVDKLRAMYAIEFLKQHGLHEFCMSNLFQKDSSDWMEGISAAYVSTYCAAYPKDLLSDKAVSQKLRIRIEEKITSFNSHSPSSRSGLTSSLNILRNLPRILLLPHEGASPLFLLSLDNPNADMIKTLAATFGSTDELAEKDEIESSAAKALYFQYLEHNSTFWGQVIKAADTVAILDCALAAITLIGAIISAKWAALPSEAPSPGSPYILPTERSLANQCNGGQPLPHTGVEAIMGTQSANTMLAYLMKPAQTFSNIVGGGRGDVESAAWKVAVAKHDLLVRFHAEINKLEESPEIRSILSVVGKRISLGPMGGTSQIGGRVGTLER